MNWVVQTNYQSMILCIKVRVFKPCRLQFRVYDQDRDKIELFSTYRDVVKEDQVFVRLPLTAKQTIIEIFNPQFGNRDVKNETSFEVVSISKDGLKRKFSLVDIINPNISEFVKFAQRFSFNAPYLEEDKCYQSEDNKFTIEYLKDIVNSNGQILKTPARINSIHHRIQISKNRFDNYSVPMRMVILLHEFAHYYMNENSNDETEADLNALHIYLGLGYPRIEATEAFLDVFQISNTPANAKRYRIIENFMLNYEK